MIMNILKNTQENLALNNKIWLANFRHYGIRTLTWIVSKTEVRVASCKGPAQMSTKLMRVKLLTSVILSPHFTRASLNVSSTVKATTPRDVNSVVLKLAVLASSRPDLFNLVRNMRVIVDTNVIQHWIYPVGNRGFIKKFFIYIIKYPFDLTI